MRAAVSNGDSTSPRRHLTYYAAAAAAAVTTATGCASQQVSPLATLVSSMVWLLRYFLRSFLPRQ